MGFLDSPIFWVGVATGIVFSRLLLWRQRVRDRRRTQRFVAALLKATKFAGTDSQISPAE